MMVNIESTDKDTQSQSSEIEFYVVSQKKLLILFISSFGIYTVYWFYKHWSQYKKSTNKDAWPVMRGIFSIFFVHSLFSLFEEKYENKTGAAPKSIGYLATMYVVFSIGCQIVGNLSEYGYAPQLTFFLSLSILPVSGWVLYNAQSLANYAGEDVLGEANSKLTGLNYLWLLLAAAFWSLLVFGLFSYVQLQKSKEEVRTSYVQYFTETDERIKMTHFNINENAVDIVLELNGMGNELSTYDMETLQANSKMFIRDKVCGAAMLVEFIDDGNYVTVDILNGDSESLENIINLSFSRGSCE